MPFSQVVVVVSFVVLLAAVASAAPAGKAPLLVADFEASPRKAGWEAGADRGRFKGAWATADADSRGRFIVAERGHWQSPPLAVEPLAYYRLRFRAKAPLEGSWVAEFFGADGDQLQADHYDSLPGSRRWRAHEYFLRANANAALLRVRFIAHRAAVAVDDVRIDRSTPQAAAAWADKVYAALPPVAYRPPAGRCKLLPKTMHRLRAGPSIRVVLLGDSIANDTSNSAFDALLQRAYPNCRVELVNSVRGGTGCNWYRRDDRVGRYVLPFKPDLLVIAGISNGYDCESIREVIRQVRRRSDCEVMVLTGCVHPRVQGEINFAESAPMSREAACKVILAFPQRIAAMAAAEKVELLDIRKAWDDYILASPQPHAWFMRDPVHANTRGKQVLGRILLRYFAPRGAAKRP